MATVYKLSNQHSEKALKVFKAMHRNPEVVSLSKNLLPFSRLPGLEVCERTVLNPRGPGRLLHEEPDLNYAVLMPWVEGTTWMDLLTGDDVPGRSASLTLARAFCQMMVNLEEHGVAHCDLSGPNLLIELGGGKQKLFLVDVEQLHGPGLQRPSMFLVGTPGYSHSRDTLGLWGPHADRFAGAVLLAEILGWCDLVVRRAAWGESYFDPEEMHQGTARFETLSSVLGRLYGNPAAACFVRAWQSHSLAACPSFQEWLRSLPHDEAATPQPESAPKQPRAARPAPSLPVPDSATVDPESLLKRATASETAGRIDQALTYYERLLEASPSGSRLNATATQKINELSLEQLRRTFSSESDVVVSGPTPAGATSPQQTIESANPAPRTPVTGTKRVGRPPDRLDDAKRYGGLTRDQFIILLIMLPFLGAIFMFIAAQLLSHTWVWRNISIIALLGPAIYGALRRKWLTLAVYIPVVLIGAFVVSQQIGIVPLFVLVLASGLIMEVLSQLGTKVVEDPIEHWHVDLAWMATAGMLTGLFVVEALVTGIQVVSLEYVIVNLIVGALGWLIGRYLYQVIILLREQTG